MIRSSSVVLKFCPSKKIDPSLVPSRHGRERRSTNSFHSSNVVRQVYSEGLRDGKNYEKLKGEVREIRACTTELTSELKNLSDLLKEYDKSHQKLVETLLEKQSFWSKLKNRLSPWKKYFGAAVASAIANPIIGSMAEKIPNQIDWQNLSKVFEDENIVEEKEKKEI